METPVRILSIVPYEGMRIMLTRAAAHHPEICLDCRVGNLEEGLQTLRSARMQDYDVIVSRGGTAEMLRQSSPLPIIEVALSVYDVLRSLRLLDQYSRRYAVVGFPAITQSAYILKDLLRAHFDIVTIHEQEEAEPQLMQLKEAGYEMLVGDTITCATAQMLGLDNILINSGAESIENALEEAVSFHRYCQSLNRKIRVLEQVVQPNVAVLDQQKHLLFSNLAVEDENRLLSSMRHECDTLTAKGSCFFQRRSKSRNTLYQVTGKTIPWEKEAAGFVFSVLPQSTSEEDILYLTADMLKKRSTGFSESRFHSLEVQQQLEDFMGMPYPLIIYGETGIGKESLVHLLYRRSAYAERPLVSVQCEKLSAKSWTYLLTSLQSPLNGERTMILLSHCERMPPLQRQQLISLMEGETLFALNKVLFTFTQDRQPTDPLFLWLAEHTRAMKVHLPPLRESAEDIPNMIALSISALNRELGTQIIGMDHSAAHLMQTYSWPGNYAQFQRALTQMVISARGNIINEDVARKILLKEPPPQLSSVSMLLHQSMTLAQYERLIVQSVLEKEGYNQTRAAARLGISRSTLWRMLKNDSQRSPICVERDRS